MIEPQVASARNLTQILRMAVLAGDQSPDQTPEEQINDLDALDIGAWESEKDPEPAETDPSVLITAREAFAALATHEPVDPSAGWDDFDANLPSRASPLARSEDAEARAKLRLLLLRAIREGSIPGNDVHDHSCNLDGSTNEEGEAFLSMVANDLGAEVDERFEYQNGNEDFKVAVDPEESAEEEFTVDEAMAAIDAAASRRNDPLRMFQREFQRFAVLSAQEELELAQAMESSLRAAIEALCSWPEGIKEAIVTIADAGIANIASAASASEDLDDELESDPIDAPIVNLRTQDDDGELAGAEESMAEHGTLPETPSNDAISNLIAAACLGEPDIEKRSAMQAALAALHGNPALLSKIVIRRSAGEAAKRFAAATAAFNSARDRMATANIKLAFHVAKKHMRSGELLDDLTQEANIGLLKAVDRYDWRRGFRFSTYATWWIRQQVSRHVADKCRTIRFPVHIHEKHQRLVREAQQFEAARGREPTIEELAEILEMPPRKAAELLRLPSEPIPIDDAEIDGGIAIESQDDFTSPDPADIAERAELRGSIDSLLADLSKKEQQIIRLRYGLGDLEPLTLDDIGRRLELTRERIRQIESAAIKKLAANGTAFKAAKKRGRPRKEESAPAAEQPADSGESRRPEMAQPADIAALLRQAKGLGLLVEDRSDEPGSLIWVKSKEAPDGPIKLIAPWLEEFGFKLWPGEGYWR